MSKHHTMETQFKDRAALVAAIAKVCEARGISYETHEAPVMLRAYNGAPSGIKAEVVIRKEHLGPYVNDMGFARQAGAEVYTAHVPDYREHLGEKATDIYHEIKRTYAQAEVEKVLRARGFAPRSTVTEGGAVTVQYGRSKVR